MRRVPLFVCLCGVAAMALTLTAASPQSSKCDGLNKDLAAAQTQYNKAVGAWKQATVKTIQAQATLDAIDKRLATNQGFIDSTKTSLEEANTLLKQCDDAVPAPLDGCSRYTDRIKVLNDRMASLAKSRDSLMDERKANELHMETCEQNEADARAAERAAQAALEKAKAALKAAKCPRFV